MVQFIPHLNINNFQGNFSGVFMSMQCIKCGHDRIVKNGSVQGKPKKKCKACGYQWTKDTMHDYQWHPLRIKLLAVWLYISGLSMRRISRICRCSHRSVLNWVRDYAREHYEKPPLTDKIVILEVDEMWHYLKKNLASSGSGKPLIVIQDNSLTGNVGIVIKEPSENCITACNMDT
jgi:transposase-like protein